MGQCSVICCRVTQLTKEQQSNPYAAPGIYVENLRRPSINDSGHSSPVTPSPNQDTKISPQPLQRCSQSSDSSGKFSFKESMNSPADFDKNSKGFLKSAESSLHPYDIPVFLEEEEEKVIVSLSSPQRAAVIEGKKQKRPMSSVGQKRAFNFSRTRSSSTQYQNWSKTFEESGTPRKSRKRRTVSLRLTKSRHLQDVDSKVPTVYVEEDCKPKPNNRRKSSIRKALSLLSLDSMHKESSSKSSKPIQKILRHPTKRHTTVRGMSGLAIDVRSQASYRDGLKRGQSLVYYPTNTSIRTALSHTYSSDLY